LKWSGAATDGLASHNDVPILEDNCRAQHAS
jgi:hypothetical protein